jgi:hypothetical protein
MSNGTVQDAELIFSRVTGRDNIQITVLHVPLEDKRRTVISWGSRAKKM